MEYPPALLKLIKISTMAKFESHFFKLGQI